MRQYIPVLKRTRLFAGVSENELASMLTCLDARFREYKKGEYVFRQGKHISYLSEEAKKQNSSSFIIPFNRQQLADFLSVDRSVMSNELCRMRDEGLLEFDKSAFKLL